MITHFITSYKSVFGLNDRGIACNSVRKHKNSPHIHINVTQTTFNAHHEKVVGNSPL